MKPVSNETVLQQLNWRYATKKFDPARPLSKEDWSTLEQSLVLTPSSFGLQPWRFIVITDPDTKSKLKSISWGQQQVVDGSHVVVFATRQNLSADDIGFSAKNIGRQAEFIKTVPPATIELRHSLHVLNPKTGGPRHGLTIGAGAAANATRHAQNAFNNKGVRGAYATFATIVSGFGKAALKPATPGQKARIDCPCAMRFETSGKILADGLQVFFIATTLNRLFFNARPFWGRQSGPIRASSFAYPVANVWRWGLPMMYGSETRRPPPGATSFSGTEFSITCAEPYVMDGEFFEGQENQPLRVVLGPAFTFIIGPARP